MPSILKSLLPWILFFGLFGHTQSSAETATVVALAAHLIFNYRTLKKGFVLDWGGLIFFALFTGNIFVTQHAVITSNGYLISNVVLALIAWLSLAIKKPFSGQYAALQVSPEITKSSGFIAVNYILTTLWAILLSLMTVPNLLEMHHPIQHQADVNIGITIILMLVGVWASKKFPDWFINKVLDKKFNIDIQTLYTQYKMPDQDYTEFNIDAIIKNPDKKTQVIIVGAGPIGLASAVLLQQYGIAAIVLEKHPGVSFHPKARYISCRSMELFRKLGIEEQVKKYNLPEHQNWFGWFSQLMGKRYARVLKKTDYLSMSPTDEGSGAQPDLEKALLDQFTKKGGQICFEHEVKAIAQSESMTQITALDKMTQKEVTFQAEYLLAADGASFFVRDALKIPMIGPGELNTVVSIYCEIDLSDVLEKENWFSLAFIVRPGRPAPVVLSIDGKTQWIFIFPSAGTSAEILKKMYTDQYAKEQIGDVVGTRHLEINILSKNVWSLGAQVANQLTAGRTFLLGDAAHRFPPTGGMGMNTGLQDADNLMWKIAHVLKNKASGNILDSYQQERVPAILKIMQWSLENLKRIVFLQRRFDDDTLQEMDFQAHAQSQETHLNKSGLDLGIIYTSSIIEGAESCPPTIPSDQYMPNTYPGARLPHFELVQNNKIISSLDLVSESFIFLCAASDLEAASLIDFKGLQNKLIIIGDTSDIAEAQPGTFQKLLGLECLGALWVRPDGHIAWRGSVKDATGMSTLGNLIGKMAR